MASDENRALKKAGLRATSCRIALLRELKRRKTPVTHGDLERAESLKDFDRVTLYRTLNVLEERGLLHRVLGLDGVWRHCRHDSHPKGCPGDHIHLVCTNCGKMICLDDQPLPIIKAPDGWTVTGKQCVGYGLCGECIKEDEENVNALHITSYQGAR
ncbi:MAG: transcriptional regulator [Dethiosulfovibrio peptidovorans]|nr:MAG: transcriptional regulator [Dethiosulfovibrio peptidovorans]